MIIIAENRYAKVAKLYRTQYFAAMMMLLVLELARKMLPAVLAGKAIATNTRTVTASMRDTPILRDISTSSTSSPLSRYLHAIAATLADEILYAESALADVPASPGAPPR